MAVLFLDPLALGLLLGLLVYVWLVWRGTIRRWFGRDEAWTVLAWPVPLLVIGVPPVANGLLWLAEQVNVEIGGGGVGDAALYAAAYLVPAAIFGVWPPRWLLPRWARRRLTPLVAEGGSEVPSGAMPAVQANRGHGSRARWAWRVDGLAGHIWVEGPTLRFRSVAAPDPAARVEVDEAMVAELRFADDGELTLATPRGGWWSRGRLDIALGEVDRLHRRAVVPWRRDGLVTVEVTGRTPVQLWVADIRRLGTILDDGSRGGPSDPHRGADRPA
jgi:hypothetical protein